MHTLRGKKTANTAVPLLFLLARLKLLEAEVDDVIVEVLSRLQALHVCVADGDGIRVAFRVGELCGFVGGCQVAGVRSQQLPPPQCAEARERQIFKAVRGQVGGRKRSARPCLV